MTLLLQVFAPVSIGRIYVSTAGKSRITKQLTTRGWVQIDLRSKLDLASDFYDYHECYCLDITPQLLAACPPGMNTGAVGVTGAQLWFQSTGIVLFACTYEIEEELFGASVRNAYDSLTHAGGSGHFLVSYAWVKSHLSDVIGSIPSQDDFGIASNQTGEAPHWTHGIYVHKAASVEEMLSRDQLGQLVRTDRLHEHEHLAAVLRARFGWETSALSGTQSDELWAVADLVKVIGYVWELHFTLNSLAENKLRANVGIGARSLASARTFRRNAAVLLCSCHLTHLTMTERHLHIIEMIMAEWKLDELKHGVGDTTELLDIIYTQAREERDERWARQFSIIVGILTGAMLISVTTDAVKFIEEHGSRFTTWSILLGPVAVFLLVFGWWLRRHSE